MEIIRTGAGEVYGAPPIVCIWREGSEDGFRCYSSDTSRLLFETGLLISLELYHTVTQARLAGHLAPEVSCFCLLPCHPLNHKCVPLHPVFFFNLFLFFFFWTGSTHILRNGRSTNNLPPCKPLCGLRLVSTYMSPCKC